MRPARPTRQNAAGTVDLQRVNHLIGAFGESVKRFFRDQQRSAMTSPMFNLPGRLVLGSHCYFENLPGLLAEILERTSPEAIGRRMKRLCARPNYLHLNSLALGYLVGREQARLTGVSTGDDAAQVAGIMEFWAGVARSCRNDGLLLPDDADFSFPVLPDATVADLVAQLPGELPQDHRRLMRRLQATLELYTFILHGEARVGVLHHGPYGLPGGDIVIVRELIGLRDDFYPWAKLQAVLPYDHLACVMRLRDVRARIVLFGSLTTAPSDYASHIVSEQTFIVGDDLVRPLPEQEIPPLIAIAGDAQLELYRRVMEWDDRYRIEYGADLYAGLLRRFAEPLGFADEFGKTIRERFSETIARHLDDLHTGEEQPLVLHHIANTSGPVFSPVTVTDLPQ